MGFSVKPQSVDQFAGNLDLLHQANVTAVNYCKSNSNIAAIDGLFFAKVKDSHDKVINALQGSLGHLGDLYAASAAEVRKVEKLYTSTDSKHAKILDNLYPKDGN